MKYGTRTLYPSGNSGSGTPKIIYSEDAKKSLKTTSSWAAFFAVLNFIYIGLIALGGIAMFVLGGIGTMAGTFLSDAFPFPFPFLGVCIFLGIIYLAIAVVMIFPALYLYRFSQKILKAISLTDTQSLTEALENMKSYWKFIGIMTIVSIGLYILMIPVFIIIAVAGVI